MLFFHSHTNVFCVVLFWWAGLFFHFFDFILFCYFQILPQFPCVQFSHFHIVSIHTSYRLSSIESGRFYYSNNWCFFVLIFYNSSKLWNFLIFKWSHKIYENEIQNETKEKNRILLVKRKILIISRGRHRTIDFFWHSSMSLNIYRNHYYNFI